MYLGRAETRTMFAIETNNGKLIRAHSHMQNDDEILLLPGIRLTMMGSVRHTDGTHIIHLREIEPFGLLAIVSVDKQITTSGDYRNPRLEQLILSSEMGGDLRLDSMQLNDHDMEIVVDFGIHHKRCLGLSLCNNAITPVGAAILARGIENAPRLLSLKIHGNQILDAGSAMSGQGVSNGTKWFHQLLCQRGGDDRRCVRFCC